MPECGQQKPKPEQIKDAIDIINFFPEHAEHGMDLSFLPAIRSTYPQIRFGQTCDQGILSFNLSHFGNTLSDRLGLPTCVRDHAANL